MEKINLLIIEDNRMLREGITAMIEKESDLAMMAALGWSETTLTKVSDSKPDVLLLGFSLANQDSFELLQSVKMNCPETKVIIIDIVPLQSHIVPFIRAGVSGFLLKDASTDDFLSTIRSVSVGEKVLPLNLTESLFSQIVNQAVAVNTEKISRRFEAVRLTQRELQVIDCVSEGITNKEIADKLCISVYTVKSHIHNILEKLALHSRIQIANYSFNIKKASAIAENNSPENE
jgi:DNA-binding NarL/FixJ family response regulator